MAERRCKQHPEHRQTKGVCPYCLRERLDILSGSSSAATTSTSLDACSTAASFSSVSSVSESPKRRRQEPLRKSRSLAFVIGEEKEEEKREKRNKDKKKDRFWSRFITAAAGKRRDAHAAFKHSKTLKEKSSSSLWLLF
ncbi:hypothetical protein J5N97_009669 [Dioscorea zingiberensis]|uniref:Uncharacterized protein n=1 Tax=Dioscorea zingiberensis TaxID=325984 RepID=A0A9D5CYS4_9LILI|nr:hypothetical protein J5N97_009669 [Dioscorea zingiberensis]